MFDKKQYNRQYRLKNKEKLTRRMLEWQRKNRNKCHAYQKKWYEKNKQKNYERSKKWAQAHPERMVEIVLKSRTKHKEKFENYQVKFDKTAEGKYRQIKCRHQKRFFGELLALEEFKNIIYRPCIYCGEDEKPRGIDRIDNSLGYTKENSFPACQSCNFMKKAMTKQEFLSHIEKIYRHIKTK